ncbi:MATE family efflux transporter [Neptunicoccus cionae]|uniref:MATE family efflux transporter n=1 Tax=Neptunicoccus cionae TaxID=2035344 RepID=UPI00256FEC90|nr:MATE family efflux transporter [Amylibacter cionae]
MNTTPPMTWRAHIRASLLLGLPLVGSHIAQMLTHITDVAMLGWYSVDALAAVVLATQAYFVVFIVGAGFAFAVMPLCAAAIGAGNDRQVRRSVRMGAWLVTIYGLLLAVPLWNIETILLFLGQQENLAQIASDYMRIAVFGLFPSLWIMVFKSYLSALERAQVVLIATLVAAGANVVFNYAFIFGNFGFPEMGARGAAWASILTITIDFLYLLFYCWALPALKKYDLFLNPFRFDREAFVETFKLGWPISLTLLAETGLFSAATVMIGWSGTVALAAHAVVLQITSVGFMVPLGISNVGTIRAGRALGRKDKLGLSRAAAVVIWGAFLFSLVTMTLYLTIPRTLMRLFLDPSEPNLPAIIEMGVLLLMISAAFQIVDATQVAALGMLRGIKDTTVPMVLAVISYWCVGAPMAYILGFPMGYGAQGVWGGLVIGLTLAATTMLARYYKLQRELDF